MWGKNGLQYLCPDKYKMILKETGFEKLESGFEGEIDGDEYHFWVLAKKNK